MTVSTGTSEAGGRSRWAAAAIEEVRSNGVIYGLIGALLAASLVRAALTGESFLPFLEVYALRAQNAALLFAVAALVFLLIRAVIRDRQAPLREFAKSLSLRSVPEALPRYLGGTAVLVVMMAAFLFNKMLIPDLVAFSWDPTFAAWDRLLFAGSNPWELLQPLLGYPLATRFFDVTYSIWIPLVFLSWVGVLSPKVPTSLRRQYWLATVVSWIVIGLVLATVFSSAGPCYFAQVAPGVPSPYAGLDAYLASVDQMHGLMANDMKQYLWAIHTDRLEAPGGISAMPSMHNAQAALFAVLAFRLDRRLGYLFSAYAFVIFIGSIHLGWHYAVDGIAGVVLALIIWKAVEWYLGRASSPEAVAA